MSWKKRREVEREGWREAVVVAVVPNWGGGCIHVTDKYYETVNNSIVKVETTRGVTEKMICFLIGTIG